MKVLFFLPYARAAASCRYRIHQFVPYLEAHGVECDLREFVDPALYEMLYAPGKLAEKIARFSGRALKRLRDVVDVRHHDVVFVHRECFPLGPPFMEDLLSWTGKPIVYDFDDSIYMLSDPHWLRNAVRRPTKTPSIIRLASEVIVSNEYLRAYSAQYGASVTIVPTSVDTTVFRPPERSNAVKVPTAERPLRLGWIGSHSTAKYLKGLHESLPRVAARFPVEFLVVGAGRDVSIPGVRVQNRKWDLETELLDFQSLDIGLYPLQDPEWDQGKAGFKTIQYMAVGVPTVASRIGVNCTIVRDGENGFLASSPDEWVEKLCALCASPELRQQFGVRGRRTVLEDYSLASTAPKLLEVLRRAGRASTSNGQMTGDGAR